MLHTRFKAESPVLRVGSCHGTQPKVTGLSALPRKANLDKPAACRAPTEYKWDESQCPPFKFRIQCEIQGGARDGRTGPLEVLPAISLPRGFARPNARHQPHALR